MPNCVKCGHALPDELKVFRQTLCPGCSAYLHACIQCDFHDPRVHNQCLEPQAEFVANREKANFCEFFQVAGSQQGQAVRASRERKAEEARAKLESLFKRPADDEDADDD
jgi:hypothetical protein